MSKKIIIGSILASIIIIAVLFGVLNYSVSIDGVNLAQVNYNNDYGFGTSNENAPGKLGEGEKNPDGYFYNTWFPLFESQKEDNPDGNLPVVRGFDLFCIEPGAHITWTDTQLTLEEALEMVGDTYESSHFCAQQPRLGDKTYPIFEPKYTKELPTTAAYIVSDPNTSQYGGWTWDKAVGLWDLRDHKVQLEEEDGTIREEDGDFGLIVGDKESDYAAGHESHLDEEAIKYGNFDYKVRDKGMQPKNITNYGTLDEKGDVEVYVDRESKKYTVGKFKLDYTSGEYEGIAFGGISNMILYGYNRKGELVRDDIEIEKFVLCEGGAMGSEVDPEYFEPDPRYKTDKTKQVYPGPNEDFYVVFTDPNDGLDFNDPDRVAYVDIKVDFKYMQANGEYTYFDGFKYKIAYWHAHSNFHSHLVWPEPPVEIPCWACKTTCYLAKVDQQDLMSARAIRSIFEESLVPQPPDTPPTPPPPTPPEITTHEFPELQMDLGGIVWEDAVTTKEMIADGVSNTEGDLDRRLKNVKVTLYTEDGEIAELLTDESTSEVDEEELYHRINPTLTDENGEYIFRGLDPMKKYYVVFEYNGQRYLPTEYLNSGSGKFSSVEAMVNAGLYNTTDWEVTSKGTESEGSTVEGVEISRDSFDQRFSEITAYPENYPSSNSLGQVGSYNSTFTQRDLMGYTLTPTGQYVQSETQLVDGYLFDANGNETTEFSEGAISKAIREYIESNRKFPDDGAMQSIYSSTCGGTDGARKAQFIEDCYIQAYSGAAVGGEIDLYPVYDKFRINSESKNQSGSVNYDTQTITIAGTSYPPIYPGQFFVNLGLWRRQEFDAALRKDLFKAAIKINGKTLTYDYDERAEENQLSANNGLGIDNTSYWDIKVRLNDYDAYYGFDYNRDIYESDYNFGTDLKPDHPGEPLEVYATYQIAVTNQSMSVVTEIKELVDYYDADYTFKPNLSWVTYQYYRNTNKQVTENYYNMMDEPQSEVDNNGNNLALKHMSNGFGDILLPVTESIPNRPTTTKVLGGGYKNLYIHAIENQKLKTGQTIYLYLTFQVNKDGSDRILVDNDETSKHNIVEINGYNTYYGDGTTLPNGVSKGSGDIAGLLDRDSNPGNLQATDVIGERYQHNFEDDTDEAPLLNVLLVEEDIRKLNGTVWEDERTEQSGEALIGDGIRQEDETKIAGVSVELVEKREDGTEYLWYSTRTGSDGTYNFERFIPGDYIVRFKYGDSDETALSTVSVGRTGANVVAYNGQDFKSTSYQDGISQDGTTDLDEKYHGYTDTAGQNETGTYGYDIYKADQETEAGNNYSDAKDIWSKREGVINYSKENVTNHIAEVLASPYQVPTYNGVQYSSAEMGALYDELIANTQMLAETGVISVEVEYDRQTTDGDDEVQNNAETSSKDYYTGSNKQNGNYIIANVDFGLEERPKSQLEIDKSVANVRVTLANNNILFDINEAANNALWQDHIEYNIGAIKSGYNGIYPTYYETTDKHRYSYREIIDSIVRGADKGLIQLTMDEEIMHGATIQVTYAIKVTNIGEADYIDGANKNFYYLGDASGAHLSTTTTEQVVDYLQNNLRFDENATSNAPNGEGDSSPKTNAENGWSVIEPTELIAQNLVNAYLTADIGTFIDIIQSPNFGERATVPGESITKTLILSQEITPENTADDLTYSNMAEIVMTSNEAGRRMAYSVVGNQDPTLPDVTEIDASIAERIIILPPFGDHRIYYLLGITIGAVLIGGIILIRMKVLKGKNKK